MRSFWRVLALCMALCLVCAPMALAMEDNGRLPGNTDSGSQPTAVKEELLDSGSESAPVNEEEPLDSGNESGSVNGEEPLDSGMLLAPGKTYPALTPEGMGAGQGMMINGAYTYCIDERRVWPDDGTLYTHGSTENLDEETKEMIARCLNAGYPRDQFGLSRLFKNPTNGKVDTPNMLALWTQLALWAVMERDVSSDYVDMVLDNDYGRALYIYAICNKLPEGYKPTVSDTRLSSVGGQLNWDKERELYTGTLTLLPSRATDATIEFIPEGVSVYMARSQEELLVGDTISVWQATDLTLTSPDESCDGADMEFSYDYCEAVKGSSLFIYQPVDEKYQRMTGYGVEITSKSHNATVTVKYDPVVDPKPEPEPDPKPKPDPKPDPEPEPNPNPNPNPNSGPDRPNRPNRPGTSGGESDNTTTSADETEPPPAAPVEEILPLVNDLITIIDNNIPLGALPITGRSLMNLLPLSSGALLAAGLLIGKRRDGAKAASQSEADANEDSQDGQ